MKGLVNKRNGIIAAIIIFFIIAAVIVSTSFSSAMNLDKAKEEAQKYVPSTAKFITSEEEDRYFEVAFYDEGKKENFEVEVNKETGEVKKVESQLSDDSGSKTITLSEEDAKKVIKDRFKGVTSVSVVLTKDNGLFEYEASFKADDFYGDADVNAETGAVLDSVVKYGTVVTIPADESSNNEMLTYDQAKDAVIKEAGGGTVRDIDLDRENQEYFYEVELHLDGMERDYRVNAKTGQVTLENEHECYFEDHHEKDPYVEPKAYTSDDSSTTAKSDQPSQSSKEPTTDETAGGNSSSGGTGGGSASQLISEEEAKDIVRTKIPGAQFVEFYLERDDGRQEYEGKAHLDGYEYEFEINAASGVVTNWDKERIEYDDKYDDDEDWDD